MTTEAGSASTQRSMRPPVPRLVAVALALIIGQLLVGRQLMASGWLLALLSLTVIVLGLWRRGRIAALMVAAFAWGNWSAQGVLNPSFDRDHITRWCDGVTRVIEARVSEDSSVGPQRGRLRLEVERLGDEGAMQAAQGSVLLTVHDLERQWLASDLVRVPLRLRRPRNFGNPGEFDYESYLARQGIYATAFLGDDSALELIDRRPSAGWLTRWRRGVGSLIDEHLAGDDRALLRALIIGDTAGLSRPLQQEFTTAGVNHVLSISGLHVGMVATFGYVVWRWLLARSRWLLLRAHVPKLAVAASVIPVLLYAGIAGSSTAMLRSLIMVLIFLGAVLVDRERDLIVSLAAAALLIAVLWPGAPLDISFQLSFMAVLSLVLALERFWPWWRQWEERHLVRLRHGPIRFARPVAAYLAVSCAAFAGTAPLAAFHFNQLSLVALLANAVVVPLIGTAAVALGLTAALVYPLSRGLAGVLVWLAWPFLWLGRLGVWAFAAIPHAAVRVVTPTVLELGIVYGALFIVMCARGRWRRLGLCAVAIVGGCDALWWYGARYHRTDLQVTFLSVGQGDSAVVECPGAKVMVIDGGGMGNGSFDVGERVLAPFLWSHKIAHVDALVMSHPQWDHFGGLTFLARQFSPNEFWSTGERASGGVRFAELEQALTEASVRPVIAVPGMDWLCGDARVRVLAPEDGVASTNDRSLVVQLQRGPTRLLFTGDIEHGAEAALIASADGQLKSTVLKVPHHGSATSSTPAFVAAVAPRLAVVSLGLDNRFGFPAVRTEVTYRTAGVPLLRTDRDGAITVRVAASGEMVTRTQHSASAFNVR